MPNLYIVSKFSFEALHNWEDCDIKEVEFLSYPHRHIFFVTMKWDVISKNRDKEFISMKRIVENFVSTKWKGNFLKNLSCEMMADILFQKFNASYVSVFEDNENGAEVVK